MKVCKVCAAECEEDANFCPKCGGKLEERVSDGMTCPSCGAAVAEDASFCGKCGAPLNGKKYCPSCGKELGAGDRFCPSCGAPVSGGRGYAPARKKTSGGNAVKTAVNAVKAFESRTKLIANVIVLVLSVVFLFVALFAPVKVSISGMAQSMSSSGYSSSEDEEITTVTRSASQSIFKILGAYGYMMLDPDNDNDFKKIREIMADVEEAQEAAQKEFAVWARRNEYATDEECADKMAELVAKHASDYNILGYTLAITTVGAYDKIVGSGVEARMADLLDTQRNTAIMSLVMATIVSLMQIAIAVFSVVMIVFAIIGLVQKKKAKLFGAMGTVLGLSGVGIILTSFAPLLVPSGAMFALCLTVALSYFCVGLTLSFVNGRSIWSTVKRAVIAAIALISFFVLCTNILAVGLTAIAGSQVIATQTVAPLGSALESLLMFMFLKSIVTVETQFSIMTIAGAIATMLLGMAALAVIFAWMWRSLVKLADKNANDGAEIAALIGAIIMVLLAIASAVLGIVGEAPVVTGNAIGMHIAFNAYAPVYVSMSFAVAAFVFGLVFDPAKLKPVATDAKTEGA